MPWNKNKTFNEKNISNLILTVETGKYKTYSETSIRRVIRKYLINKYGQKCMICGLSEWMGVKIPLVCDHIDGNYQHNELNNFRIICNNCDSIQPTFKNKNKGNGRQFRY